MSEVKETNKVGAKAVQVKAPNAKGGRPRKYVPKTGVSRETRVPIAGMRDVIPEIQGKDPNFRYYFELDSDETGARINRRLRAGYTFVQAEEVDVPGTYVYSASNVGTIVRVPNANNGFLYLMKIPMEWYLEDVKAEENKVKETEETIYADSKEEGRYGSVKLSRE